jgi:hypothetical protein
MIIRYKKLLLTLGALVLLGATAIPSQTRQSAPDGPRLYRIWSDDRGETHLEQINIATKGRPTIRGREYLRIIYGPEYTLQEHMDRQDEGRPRAFWPAAFSR